MSENDSSQEKTEDPTAKKLEKAKEEGQVPRSKELSAAAVLIVGVLCLMWFSSLIAKAILEVFTLGFTFTRADVFQVTAMFQLLHKSALIAGKALIPMFIMLVIASFMAPIAMGSWNFSIKALSPKLSKMDPIKGFKKMFGMNGLMEMLKSLAKFFVIACMGILSLYVQYTEILALAHEPINQAVAHGVKIVVTTALIIVLSLLIIAAIDVPFQIWNTTKQLKMTKQEVKDEFKDTEGKPEVKGRIRQLQREMAQQRMMSDVPKADVVITNPTHFSVALRYDPDADPAPVLVAKGADFVALKIREIANFHEITIIEAPPLARAVYHNTKIGQEIPDELYLAVAQVLAYVFRLNEYKKGKAPKPGPMPKVDVPRDLYTNPKS